MMDLLGGLRARVVTTVALVTAVLFSVAGTIGFRQITDASRATVRDRVEHVIDQLEQSLRNGGSAVELRTPDGVVVRVVDPSAPPATAAANEVVIERTITLGPTHLRLVGRASLAPASANLVALHRGLWIGVALAVVLTALIAGLATHQVLRPVARITKLSRTISSGESSARVPVPETTDEIADLAKATNEMLDRIASGWTAQRQFTSDAAHELRTPLMALQGEIELAQRAGGVIDSEFLARTARQAARLGTLIDDLVLLSSLDEARPVAGSAVSLMDLVRDETDALATPHVVSGDEGATVFVDARLVQRAIRNLLANAVRHCANAVTVLVEQRDDQVWVCVGDDGPGIRDDERHLVLQRFRRLDDGRSLDAGGTGLGLAIVESVARHHGGGVEIGTSAAGGALVSMWFPAAVVS